jgi:hypothetical protein
VKLSEGVAVPLLVCEEVMVKCFPVGRICLTHEHLLHDEPVTIRSDWNTPILHILVAIYDILGDDYCDMSYLTFIHGV